MALFTLVVVGSPDPSATAAPRIAQALLEHGAWLCARAMPFRTVIRVGDRCLVYAGGRSCRQFVGSAIVDSRPRLARSEDAALAMDLELPEVEYRIGLRDVETWSDPVPQFPVFQEIFLLKRRRSWHPSLRTGACRMTEAHWDMIMQSHAAAL